MGDLSLFLEEHHIMMRDMVREFAEAEIAPVAAEFDENEEFPWENGAKMAGSVRASSSIRGQFVGADLSVIICHCRAGTLPVVPKDPDAPGASRPQRGW